MSNIVLIGDIHNKWEIAEEIAQKYEKTHLIIFIGDHFDSYGDSEYDAEKTARWLKYSLQQKNRIHIGGNHDYSYAYCFNQRLWCPGYSPEKNRRIRTILNQNDFERLKLYYYIENSNFLISHAGFTNANLFGYHHPSLINTRYSKIKEYNKKDYIDYLKKETIKFFFAAKNNDYHHFMYQGTRMGEDGNGGPFWLHRDDFLPIKYFNQIIGHTISSIPVPCFLPNYKNKVSENWFIDCELNYYALIENNKLTIKGRTQELQEKWENSSNFKYQK